MLILGIETVTKIGSLAIVKDGKIIGQTMIDAHLRHAANLISSLDNLLRSHRIKISDIDAIAVDTGPGSFTGIRVGIASALGLAQPDNKQLIGVCSLSVLSYQMAEHSEGRNLVPVIDAKRGAFYSACYRLEDESLKTITEPYVIKSEMLRRSIPKDSFVFGPDMRKAGEFITTDGVVIVDTHGIYPHAGMAAKAAEKAPKKNLEPMYIHDIEYHGHA